MIRTNKCENKIAHGQFLARKTRFVHHNGILTNPALQTGCANALSAAECPTVGKHRFPLENIEICSAGGKVFININTDTLTVCDGNIKLVLPALAVKIAMLDANKLFFHVSLPASAAAS